MLENWERQAGRAGHDLLLQSDMRARARSAIEELGLDPDDTASKELYFALLERARRDNDWLSGQIGVSKTDSPGVTADKILAWLDRRTGSPEVWMCKPSFVRSLLKKQPPKALLKALGLRSAESMLKRNNVAEVLTLAYGLETADWKKRFTARFKTSSAADFTLKRIDFCIVRPPRAARLKKAGYPVEQLIVPNYQLGAVVVIPPPRRFSLDVLTLAASLYEAVYELRKHSPLYRVLAVRKDFAARFTDICQFGMAAATRAISDIGWNVLHRHLVGNEYVAARLEQPHLAKDDLAAESALDMLAKMDGRFGFWKGLEYVFYAPAGHRPVSLNLIDVVLNGGNQRGYSAAGYPYGRQRLWEELWARYLSSDAVLEATIEDYLKQ